MNNIQKEKNEILSEFCSICETNKIWYSLDEISLLSCYSNENWAENIDFHTVMMTFDSYEKLKELLPNRILDNTNHSDYFSLQNKFVLDNKNIYAKQAFININLIIPTKAKNIKKYLKFRNKRKISINHYATMSSSNIPKINNKIWLSKFAKKFTRLLTYKDVVNSLYSDEYEGFLVTNSIINHFSFKKWISNLSFKLNNEICAESPCKVIAESEIYLKNLYGSNFKNKEPEQLLYIHRNCIDIDLFNEEKK
ncbi:hypothetical protein [Metamycoplasma equirhinis]|uniref:hypothetical protein n=1 Tax=Metamycoplasma equirhinis TaxID=92402 RepID=UPI003593FEB4